MDKNDVSVTYNIYRTFKKEEINRDQFLPANSEEEYNSSGKTDTYQLLDRLRDFTSNKLDLVLEYGCGDGRVARFMAKECENLICLDVSPFVLEATEEKMIEHNNYNVTYILADNFDKENIADFIYSLQVLQHNPYDEQIQIIKKIQKALKPNGIACIHLPKLENRPEYENCDTCMCFTKEQVLEFGKYFSEFVLDDDVETQWNDYFLWCKK